MTVFYGIYKIENHKFLYANAGHNLPCLIRNNKITRLEANNRSIPLGVMDNEEMLEGNRSYTNFTVQLAPDSKLILFTDGLTEAAPAANEQSDFETALMEQSFLQSSSKPAKAFVNEIPHSGRFPRL